MSHVHVCLGKPLCMTALNCGKYDLHFYSHKVVALTSQIIENKSIYLVHFKS